MKFDFSKSGQPDLQNKFQYIYKRLDLLLQICRYNNELLRNIEAHYKVDFQLQKTVDDFYKTPSVGSPQYEEPDD